MSEGQIPPGNSGQPDEEMSAAAAALEERLSQPVFEGLKGLDTAQLAISAFLVLVAGVVTYSNSTGIPFHYADRLLIEDNAALHRLATAAEGWNDSSMPPIAALSVAATWVMGGGSSSVFHFVNVCLHLLNGLLVFLLARRMLGKGAAEPLAMSAGLLFIVHPVATQSVNYLVNRPILLSAFFFLCAMVLYLRATEEADKLRVAPFLCSLVCFALAWGSDVTACILPFVLIPLDLLTRQRVPLTRRVQVQAPFWALLGLFAILRLVSGETPVDARITLEGFYSALSGFPAFAAATFYPVELSVVHAPYEAAGANALLPFAILVVASLAGLRFAPFFASCALLYALGIVAPNLFVTAGAFQEERVYFPLIGAVLLVPKGLSLLPRPTLRTAGGIAAAVLILGFGSMTFLRNRVWLDESALWKEAAAVCRNCVEPFERLGEIRLAAAERSLEAGRAAALEGNRSEASQQRLDAFSFLEEAEGLLATAVLAEEAAAETWLHLGTARRLLAQRNPEMAEGAREALLEALRSDPFAPAAALQMGLLLDLKALGSGDPAVYQRALDYFGRADALDDLPDEAIVRYAALLLGASDLGGSEAVLSRLGEPDSLDPGAAQLLAQIRRASPSISALVSEISQRAAAGPADPAILHLQARLLLIRGRFLQASYVLDALHKTQPLDIGTWTLQAVCRAKMGSFDRFLADSPQAPAYSGAGSAWHELSRRLSGGGEWEAALGALQHEASGRGGEGVPPLIAMGEIASAMNDGQRAGAFYSAAARENPADPEPWLRLTDLALASGQKETAHRFITEAETRGAAEDLVAAKREQAGPAPETGTVRSFIR